MSVVIKKLDVEECVKRVLDVCALINEWNFLFLSHDPQTGNEHYLLIHEHVDAIQRLASEIRDAGLAVNVEVFATVKELPPVNFRDDDERKTHKVRALRHMSFIAPCCDDLYRGSLDAIGWSNVACSWRSCHRKETVKRIEVNCRNALEHLYMGGEIEGNARVEMRRARRAEGDNSVPDDSDLTLPSDLERDTYFAFTAGEAYAIASGAKNPTQREIYEVLTAALGTTIEREDYKISEGYAVQDSFDAFIQAYRRAKRKLSQASLTD